MGYPIVSQGGLKEISERQTEHLVKRWKGKQTEGKEMLVNDRRGWLSFWLNLRSYDLQEFCLLLFLDSQNPLWQTMTTESVGLSLFFFLSWVTSLSVGVKRKLSRSNQFPFSLRLFFPHKSIVNTVDSFSREKEIGCWNFDSDSKISFDSLCPFLLVKEEEGVSETKEKSINTKCLSRIPSLSMMIMRDDEGEKLPYTIQLPSHQDPPFSVHDCFSREEASSCHVLIFSIRVSSNTIESPSRP
jgi:hypothetical protein